MEYYPIMPKRKSWVKIVVILFGLYVIYSAVFKRDVSYLLIGIIMILATFSKRSHIINKHGINISFKMFSMNFDSKWKWDEILTIHTDSKNSDTYVQIHFGKGLISRRFIVEKGDLKGILSLAKKSNPKIFISQVN